MYFDNICGINGASKACQIKEKVQTACRCKAMKADWGKRRVEKIVGLDANTP